ncbi:hypothetical protein ACBI99_18520 [Nonomuraea sp. ATR24]|uniref:hypothetical protein n=1 Tax=unclassified Nonomuraea TaxID=2593643 RepID=UPI00340D05E7
MRVVISGDDARVGAVAGLLGQLHGRARAAVGEHRTEDHDDHEQRVPRQSPGGGGGRAA